MHTLEKIKKYITKQINEALGGKYVQASDLVYPPKPEFGDLSLINFDLARKYKKTPVEFASNLMSKLPASDEEKWKTIVSGMKVEGPYLNFTVNKINLVKRVIKEIGKEGERYGCNNTGRAKRVMVEYSNANTHKEYHVGHLRNICFGDSVNRILTANGFTSIPVSYVNDFGIHVAKTLWALEEFFKDSQPEKNKGEWLGKVYVKAIKEMEDDKLAKDKVGFIMKKIESGKGSEYKLWQKTRNWSIEQFNKIYDELGVDFKQIFYESEYLQEGMKKVESLYKKRILKKSEGAIIADLEEHDLGVLMFLRSDSSAMYAVADVPLALAKTKKFKLDRSIYITDNRQDLYFKQLFKVLEFMGHKQELVHLGYEFVKLPEGMMSSREGTVVTYRELREQVYEKAKEETRKRHEDWDEKKIEEVARALANGAIKFEMVKVSANQIITFDINQSLRFDGFTASYLQYTYARIKSIIRKAGSKIEPRKLKLEILNERRERELVIKLARYPEAVLRAGKVYDPSEIAKYIFELARNFNDYYHSVPVLKTTDETKNARLALIATISQTIKNGLKLLGIDVIEEM